MVNNIFAEEKIGSGEMFLQVLQKKCEVLTSIDASFVVDMAWAAYVSGESGKKEFYSVILGCLPNESKPVPLAGLVHCFSFLIHLILPTLVSKCFQIAFQLSLHHEPCRGMLVLVSIAEQNKNHGVQMFSCLWRCDVCFLHRSATTCLRI